MHLCAPGFFISPAIAHVLSRPVQSVNLMRAVRHCQAQTKMGNLDFKRFFFLATCYSFGLATDRHGLTPLSYNLGHEGIF
jgi:hypothetical protein